LRGSFTELQLGKVLGGGEECVRLVAEGQALIWLQYRTKLAINAPHEKHDRKFKVSRFDALRGDTKCAAKAGRPVNTPGRQPTPSIFK
jgi:hypothetical protein